MNYKSIFDLNSKYKFADISRCFYGYYFIVFIVAECLELLKVCRWLARYVFEKQMTGESAADELKNLTEVWSTFLRAIDETRKS